MSELSYNPITITPHLDGGQLTLQDFRKIVIDDYRLAYASRQASLLVRREVLSGRAKFGIFGDGKEVAQIAMAKTFHKGDWRAGYYRDQTFFFATGMLSIKEFFAQLYAHPDIKKDPSSAGRQMNAHFATRFLDNKGNWCNLMESKNSSSDISPSAGHMARLVGLALASKLFRQNKDLQQFKELSANGHEVAFGTIGDAATSEGVFFEAINAAGVLQIPMAISIWDDAYGISVPAVYHTTKSSISEVLKGFQRDDHTPGYELFKVHGWDYVSLCETYEKAINICRTEHVPVMIHVTQMTQPQGHSTSGSHERYKSRERLAWEKEYDCLTQMRQWIIYSAVATDEELKVVEEQAKKYVVDCQQAAWKELRSEIDLESQELLALLDKLAASSSLAKELSTLQQNLRRALGSGRRDILSTARKALRVTLHETTPQRKELLDWLHRETEKNIERFDSKLFTDTPQAPRNIPIVPPHYRDDARVLNGYELLNACFDANFKRDVKIVAFGEDVGAIGDVNQGLAGLQDKYGDLRIFDTGIREMTIIGQGIGLAMRGLRPIAEIQYLDYILFALNILSDDLASLSYRTKAGQKAPLIVRTRGHRLEGIWHSGSPMSTLIHTLRGIYICVPRNMTQAAGMYNTLLRADEPALVVECLNGYRLKEKLPTNVGEFTVALGKAALIQEGTDITVISYGSTLRIVQEAAKELAAMGISIEIIDPQTLLPFDLDHLCSTSLKKTNKLLVVDEDMPGGASAYIMQQILEVQNGYYYLDSQPRTLTANAHRPAYGSDANYFSKPSLDDVVEYAYEIMNEYKPVRFPSIY